MEVLQTLSCPVQLLPHISKGSGREKEVVYQFESVDGVNFDVLHDISVRHPL